MSHGIEVPMPGRGGAQRAVTDRDRQTLRRWMMACIVAVFVTLVVGGITRLTESGLSITEWKPVSGVLPPATAAEWEAAFEDFRQIPQAQTVHRDLTMSGFKVIFWWEWFHRLLARGVGLVFAIPYIVLLLRGRIPKGLRLRLTALPVLTLGQGVLGWYMVQSGLAARDNVSAYRLAAHLGLALAILAVAVWTYVELAPRRRYPGATSTTPVSWKWALGGITALLGITVLSGAFVAGLRAGTIFNTFPLMGGQVVPPGYMSLATWWTNAFENPVAAQFHHRVLALTVTALALVLVWRSQRTPLPPHVSSAVRTLGLIVCAQLLLGIGTLLLAVPVPLGVLHQFTGALALTAALVATRRATSSVWYRLSEPRSTFSIVDAGPDQIAGSSHAALPVASS